MTTCSAQLISPPMLRHQIHAQRRRASGHHLRAHLIVLQEYVDKKRKEHAALDKDYKAYAEAKTAMEAAKERTKQAAEAVKGARAAVREALKTVSDPPAVVRPARCCLVMVALGYLIAEVTFRQQMPKLSQLA